VLDHSASERVRACAGIIIGHRRGGILADVHALADE
jgi:hypothetical protein